MKQRRTLAAIGHAMCPLTWIERTYHRRQDALGRLTPIEYEATITPPAAQAA